MNWTAQDEAKWAELDARRKIVKNAAKAAISSAAKKIFDAAFNSVDSDELRAFLIDSAAELRDALEPYDDRATKQKCSQSSHADDGWIEWNGGEQPIPDGSIADVKYRDGKVQFAMEIPYGDGQHEYIAYNWKHKGMNGDIIAYRPVK